MTRRSGTDPTLSDQHLPGEFLLAAAILRQAVSDALWDQPSQTPENMHQQAITFLMDDEALDWWGEMLDADSEVLARALRVAAKLE